MALVQGCGPTYLRTWLKAGSSDLCQQTTPQSLTLQTLCHRREMLQGRTCPSSLPVPNPCLNHPFLDYSHSWPHPARVASNSSLPCTCGRHGQPSEWACQCGHLRPPHLLGRSGTSGTCTLPSLTFRTLSGRASPPPDGSSLTVLTHHHVAPRISVPSSQLPPSSLADDPKFQVCWAA